MRFGLLRITKDLEAFAKLGRDSEDPRIEAVIDLNVMKYLEKNVRNSGRRERYFRQYEAIKEGGFS